jgi:hypothetical protein
VLRCPWRNQRTLRGRTDRGVTKLPHVGTLGEVLELIHSSARRFRTARVAGRTDDSAWRLWWAGNDRFRFERNRDGGGFVNVRAGPVWWVLDSDGQAITNDGDPNQGLGMQPELGLLHPRSLLATTLLELLRAEQVAGRPAAILRATPRRGAGHWRWWGFEDSAEPTKIPIDLERGVALGGFRFQVDEIMFDKQFAPEIFFPPWADARHQVQRGLEIPREASLEEARQAAPFRVVLPEILPEGARLLKCLVDRTQPPGWVGLSWAIDPGHRYTLRLRQGPAVKRDAERFRGEESVEQGVRLLVEDAATQRHLHTLFAETGVGWYEIDSDLPLDTVMAIARSLKEKP